eukprot:1982692-Alexandrium_andersonii.AAC.1
MKLLEPQTAKFKLLALKFRTAAYAALCLMSRQGLRKGEAYLDNVGGGMRDLLGRAQAVQRQRCKAHLTQLLPA